MNTVSFSLNNDFSWRVQHFIQTHKYSSDEEIVQALTQNLETLDSLVQNLTNPKIASDTWLKEHAEFVEGVRTVAVHHANNFSRTSTFPKLVKRLEDIAFFQFLAPSEPVTVVIEGKRHQFPKQFLLRHSEVARVMFSSGMHESVNNEIILNMSEAAFEKLVEYANTGRIEQMSWVQFVELLQFAHMFEMEILSNFLENSAIHRGSVPELTKKYLNLKLDEFPEFLNELKRIGASKLYLMCLTQYLDMSGLPSTISYASEGQVIRVSALETDDNTNAMAAHQLLTQFVRFDVLITSTNYSPESARALRYLLEQSESFDIRFNFPYVSARCAITDPQFFAATSKDSNYYSHDEIKINCFLYSALWKLDFIKAESAIHLLKYATKNHDLVLAQQVMDAMEKDEDGSSLLNEIEEGQTLMIWEQILSRQLEFFNTSREEMRALVNFITQNGINIYNHPSHSKELLMWAVSNNDLVLAQQVIDAVGKDGPSLLTNTRDERDKRPLWACALQRALSNPDTSKEEILALIMFMTQNGVSIHNHIFQGVEYSILSILLDSYKESVSAFRISDQIRSPNHEKYLSLFQTLFTDEEVVKKAIEQRFMHAVAKEHFYDLLEFLVQKIPESCRHVDTEDRTVLHCLANTRILDAERTLQIIQLLLAHGVNAKSQDKTGNTALHLFLERSNLPRDIFDLMVAQDLDLTLENDFGHTVFAIGFGKDNAFHSTWEEKSLPLSQRDKDALLISSIPQYIDSDQFRNAHTIKREALEFIELALRLGANPNAFSEATSSKDSRSCPPLILARKDPMLVQKLVEAGAQISLAKDKFGRNLFFLKFVDYLNDEASLEEVEMLLKQGCDVNNQGKDGTTALHRAAIYGNTEGALFLLRRGADPKLTDENDRNPVMLAIIGGDHEDVAITILQQNRIMGLGLDLDAQDKDGKTIYYYSSRNGLKVAQWLSTT